MRYLKTYKIFEAAKTGLTKEQAEFLNKYVTGDWTYDPETGLVDVDGDFICHNGIAWREMAGVSGIRFGKVSGSFLCGGMDLTSLDGSPREVGEEFNCIDNRLTTLKGAPEVVGGDFICSSNILDSLEGAPRRIGGDFECVRSGLASLEGGPEEVDGYFDCRYNDLKSLKGSPKKVRSSFDCHGNLGMISLEGAPEYIGGQFECDFFLLRKGAWNSEGWLDVLLKSRREEAKKLALTLLTPRILNGEIQKDPAGMAIALKEVWNDEWFKETRDQLVWPRGYEKEADLLGDLDDVGF